MNLLIVDDEKTAIEAVKRGICWERLPFTTVHTATNLKDAESILEKDPIDILLCDIEMPGGSGLELLEWIKERQLDICCIFMTCHAEFSYAQQALHLGSFEYVLKPLDFEKLEKILAAASFQVKKQKELKKTEDYLEKSKKALTQQFWQNFFLGNIPDDEESLRTYINNYQLDISLDGNFIPVLISPFCLTEEMSKEERKLYGFALRNIIDEIFEEIDERKNLEVLAEDKILVVLNIPRESNEKAFQKKIGSCCQKLIQAISRYDYIQICCYVGNKGTVNTVPDQLELLLKMDLNNIINQRFIIFSDFSNAIITEEYAKADFILDAWRRFPDDYGKILETVKDELADKSSSLKDGLFMYHFFMGIYFLLDQFSNKYHIFLKNVIDEKKNRQLLLEAPNSMKALQEWLQSIKEVVAGCEKKGGAGYSVLDEVKNYIHQNLDLELSAEKVAKQVGFHVDYLNRVFKRENGISLNKYILQEKMERAKWLLKNTQWQIGDVAAAVGYYNYSSFYRTFSKQVGKSPQEYKAEK